MYDTSQAVACLTSAFLELLHSCTPGLESFESQTIRIRSRKYSRRAFPKPTREASLGKGRRRERQERIEKSMCQGPIYRVESVGSGWEYPYRASVADMAAEIRYQAGLDSGMVLGV